MKFSKEFMWAAEQTWSVIASDACVENPDDQEEIWELVLDANRIESYGGFKGTKAELDAAMEKHSFQEIVQHLANNHPLGY